MNLDRVGKALSPDFDPNEKPLGGILVIRLLCTTDSLKKGDSMSTVLEIKERLTKSSYQQSHNDSLENRSRVDLDVTDDKVLIQGFQKSAIRFFLVPSLLRH